MKHKTVIGITGGIASGKSTVLAEFKKLGCDTLDADIIAREVVQPGKPALKKIVRAFGKTILTHDGTLDRAALGAIVFKDVKKRKLLEGIVHPEVVKVLKKRIAASRKKTVAADIPLLYEVGLKGLVDKVCVVWCPMTQQVSRLKKRNKMSRAEALRRIRSQWPLAKKKKLADFVIDNSSTVKHTVSEIRLLFPTLFDITRL